MTIEEAIGRLEQTKNWYESHDALEQVEAHKLGIEALKRLKQNRLVPSVLSLNLLPAETEE